MISFMKADKLDILIGRNNVSLARDCLFFLYLYACVSFSLARSLVYARSFVYSSESRGAFIFSHLSISRRKRERGKRERQRGEGGAIRRRGNVLDACVCEGMREKVSRGRGISKANKRIEASSSSLRLSLFVI